MTTVTQILNKVYKPYPDTPDMKWYMERGTQVHACARAICFDKSFSFDPQISGYVLAIKKFMHDFKPYIQYVEERLISNEFNYSGQPDLCCVIQKKMLILDWKTGLSGLENIQLAGYGILTNVKYGMAVKLNNDGTYNTGGIIDISGKWRRYFLASLTVYNCMQEVNK